MADLTRWFLNLFPYRISSVIKREGGTKWLEISRFHHLTDEEILEAMQTKAKLQRGYRFDINTKFLVLEIPAASPYHNADTISDIRRCFEELSVRPRHYQIDEDWYLHIYLTGAGSSAELAGRLRQFCISAGYTVGPDTLRVHPCEAALPFPLQSGFTWLNERCQLLVRRDELSLDDALVFFLQDAGKSSINPEDLLSGFSQIESAKIAARKDSVWEGTDFSPAFAGLIENSSDFRKSNSALSRDNEDLQAVCFEPLLSDCQNLSAENCFDAKDSVAEGADAGNVVDMRKHRLGDELLSVYQAGRSQPCQELPAGSRLVVFEDLAASVPEPGIETESASAESQLLLFPAAKQAGAALDLAETSPARKRKSERRARQQAEVNPIKCVDPILPAVVFPEE